MTGPAPRSRVAFAALNLLTLQLATTVVSAAGVRQFTPQDRVDRQTRATAQFSADIVAPGQPDAAAPFVAACGGVAGKGSWSDARTCGYVSERPLAPGERCDFRLRPEPKAADGEASHAIFARGPRPRSLTPRPGSAIEEDQAFVIEASSELTVDSVERKVWCDAAGVGERIPVRSVGKAVDAAVVDRLHRSSTPSTLLIACQQRLPPGVWMKLVRGQGVESGNGVRSSRQGAFVHAVRASFRASFNCEHEKADRPCSPLSDRCGEFSAHSDRQLAATVRLLIPEGTRSPGSGWDEEAERRNMMREVAFCRPLPPHPTARPRPCATVSNGAWPATAPITDGCRAAASASSIRRGAITPATRVDAMSAPEVFGELPNANLLVKAE